MSEEITPANTEPSRGGNRVAKRFARLMRARISHGAFRLFHCLYDYMDKGKGTCYPAQPTIQKDIHCSNDSIKGWTDELIETGWLMVEVKGRRYAPGQKLKGCRFVYTLLDGDGQPFLKSGEVTIPKIRKALDLSQKQERTSPKSRRKAFLKSGAEVSALKQSALQNKKSGDNNNSSAPVPDCAPAGAGASGRGLVGVLVGVIGGEL